MRPAMGSVQLVQAAVPRVLAGVQWESLLTRFQGVLRLESELADPGVGVGSGRVGEVTGLVEAGLTEMLGAELTEIEGTGGVAAGGLTATEGISTDILGIGGGFGDEELTEIWGIGGVVDDLLGAEVIDICGIVEAGTEVVLEGAELTEIFGIIAGATLTDIAGIGGKPDDVD